MSLSPGTRLGSYEIVAPLGAGGMGEVYRARDVRLGRDVALKVMASRLAGNAEALERFKREARAVAALSHPNVLALFDYGESDGTVFAVAELLEGETLRTRLAAGALSQRKAVEVAVQIARGLAAAHERGITHRDLKPENVFLTRDGHVKILDFGLARLIGAGHATIESESPTLARPTDPGRVMGTAGYMSPEQVRGEAADHRSDLFAFGTILYEMLAGRRAFPGDSAVEIMTATLREEPRELPASVPPALERIVGHCLEKRPEERFRSAHDLAFDLETLADLSSVGSRGALPPAAKRGRPVAPLLLAVLLVAAGAFLARWLWRAPPPSAPIFRQLTFRRGTILGARFAPDGDTIVYGAAWDGSPSQIFTARTDRPESSPVTVSGPADLLAVSRSGEMALSLGRRFLGSAYLSSGTLASAPLAGGTPREILQGVHQADWAPDGSSLAVARLTAGGGSRLEYPIGKVLLRSNHVILDPRVSPGGEQVAAFESADLQGYRLVVFDRAGSRKLALPLGGRYPFPLGLAWHPGGQEIWYSVREAHGSGFYAVRLDGQWRLMYRLPGWTHLFDVSTDGKVLLGDHFLRHGIAALPPGEARERDLSWFELSIARDLSDDGKTLLFNEEGEVERGSGIYLRHTDGSAPVHIGEGVGRLLSPDGKWVLADQGGSVAFLPTGVGEPKRLKGVEMTSVASWFPDGRRILFASRGAVGRFFVLDMAGGPPRAITPPFGFAVTWAARPLSADGRQVAVQSADGRFLIYPLSGGKTRIVPGFEPGDELLRWSADGRSLFVWRRDPGAPARVFRLDLGTGRREPWLELHPPDPAGIYAFTSLLLTPDGKSYAYTYGRVLTNLYLAEGLK